jgi:hypothetical protein
MTQCAGIKRNGGRCTVIVNGQQEYCYQHDPARADERRRAASRAGKSKPNREILDAKQRLSQLADDVLDGTVDKGTGAVVSQVLNVYLRAISVGLKAQEVEEIAREVEELRDVLEARKERRWG